MKSEGKPPLAGSGSGKAISDSTAAISGETTSRPLFRAEQAYEIIGEIIAGDPVVIVPQSYQELAQPLLNRRASVQQLYLIGTRRLYENVPIFDVDEIADTVMGVAPERVVGVLQVLGLDGLTPQDAITQSTIDHGQVMLVISPSAEPAAFVVGPEQQLQQAGLMGYGPVPRATPEPKQPSQAIEITLDDIMPGEPVIIESVGEEEPVIQVSPRQGLPFPRPIPCAYCGHRFSRPTDLCPFCGVPICRTCREEAQGCITVGCPNSSCG